MSQAALFRVFFICGMLIGIGIAAGLLRHQGRPVSLFLLTPLVAGISGWFAAWLYGKYRQPQP